MVQRTWAAKSWPLAMRESPRVVMERVCRSESGRGFARIIARCGRQSPHLGVVVQWSSVVSNPPSELLSKPFP